MKNLNKKVPMKAAIGVLLSAAAVAAALIIFFLTHPAPAPVKAEAASLAASAPVPPAPEPTPFVYEINMEHAKTYYLDAEYRADTLASIAPFYIILDMESGMFQYYETPVSSYIGVGVFTLDGGILTMDDSYRVNRFRTVDSGDQLVWIEEGSDNFWFEKLTDGATFSLDHTPVAAVSSAD